jgi:hypothetical protein
MGVIVGPMPFQGCGRPVSYVQAWRSLIPSRRRVYFGDAFGMAPVFKCALVKWYDAGVGISDATTSATMCDALSTADTSREGIPRLEVSAP